MLSADALSPILEARLGLLAGFLLAALITDTAARKIPNKLVLGGLAVAFLCQGLFFGGSGLLDATKGMGLGFVLFLPLYLLRAMGAGDVKLMAMVGAFTGMPDIVGIVLFTLVAGGLLSLVFALKLKSFRRLMDNVRFLTLAGISKVAAGKIPANDFSVNSVGTLPYAWAITLGTAGYFVWLSL